MGVHGLWELLAPVGRRVSVETLAGKKLAIDASIWMVQFMKAMRDEKGEMVRNAHLIGFFRRICKLLFLRTKPVFVFDGGTPALKRRTVVARRRQRENAQAKIRKTAEKLLINHLKAMKLKQLNEDIRNQRQEHNAKGKKVLTEDAGVVGNISVKNDIATDIASGSYDQEKLDEMLAASLAAEEDGSFTGIASTSAAGIPLEEEEDDDDEDEEMILPAMHGKVDPAILAALPPSMQLDLLVQMREKLMAENRQKYQKVKKAPAKFSELQIQSYLKTVAFRREIDEVRKSAAGRGVGGVQTSRIASESNREFIFSSSFTGDKQALTSAGAERNGEQQHQTQLDCPSVSMDSLASSVKSSTATGSVTEEAGRPLGDNVETYLDERGHVRVSRVRALGIRMTRDLQRNLDMMKEIEQESSNANKIANFGTGKNAGLQRDFSSKNQFPGTSNGGNDENDDINESNQQFLSTNETSIQISFEDDGEHKCFGGDDDLFTSLVAGNPVMISSVDETFSRKQSSDSASDSDWEDGIIGKDDSQMDDIDAAMKPSLAEGSQNDESEVEWEEGVIDDVLTSASPRRAEGGKVVSRGCQEEEADLQDAIRRSLEDLRDEKCVDASIENESKGKSGKMDHKHENPELILRSASVSHQNNSTCVTVAAVENQAGVSGTSISQSIDASGRQLVSPMTSNFDNMEALVDGSWDSYSEFHTVESKQQKDKLSLSSEQLFDASGEGGEVLTIASSLQVNCSGISESAFGDVPDEILLDASKNDSKAGHEIADHAVSFGECSVEELLADIDLEQKLGSERDRDSLFMEKEYNMDNILVEDKKRAKVSVASVEEEMLMLGQEYINLGNEQRKNERNAESVSSEMFAECQELLQMFGLPYIIAPMEAEAQCAYLELVNLVDGVVTDDSDVFLFGARSVYKNIFDDRKYVETYFMKDIENELGLTREKIIRMALLLGSDYTEGISGIGIVNAIEVVNAFPEEDGLQKFREWIESPDPNILGKFQGKTGSGSKKRRLKVTENDVTGSDSNVEGASASVHNEIYEKEQSVDQLEEMKQIFMDKHRNVSKNWHIPSSFPSGVVISAYDCPQVDKSTEPFSWGKPDLFVLHKLCWDKFGWSNQKADELLLPVLKEYSKHETQLRLEAFYSFNERFAKIRSKRIEKAVKGITGNHSLELIDDSVQEGSKTRKKRRISHAEPGDDESEKLLRGTKNDVARNKSNSIEELHSKQLGRRKSHQKLVPSMVGNIEPSIQAVGKSSAGEVSSGNRRKENRRRRQQVGRGRKKRNPIFESADSSSSGSDSSDNKQEVPFQKLEEPLKVRRSARSRKPANYIVDDLDNDVDESLDQRSEECIVQQPVEPEISQLQGLRGDVSFGPIDNNQHKFGKPSLEPGLCGDYLETGGGFCMNGDDNGEPSVSRENASFEDERSKDYLEIGGGFCVHEDETNKAPDEHANNPTTATVAENDNFYHNLDSVDKSEHENQSVQSALSGERAFGGIQNGGRIVGSDTLQNLDLPDAANNDLSSVGVPAQGDTKDDSSTTSVRALSAMPFLRRKRRKT